MRIFLDGSSGFLGSNLLGWLQNLRHDVYCFKRGQDPWEAMKEANPEVIVHTAAELHDETKMLESNFVLTNNLLEASRDIKYRAFINIGTSSEYGKSDEPMRETDPLSPITHYGITKAQATVLCQNFAIENMKPIITLRPFSIYGIGQPDDRFLPTAIKCALNGTKLTLGVGRHDWVHVDDVCDAIIHFMSRPDIIGEVVNVGTGRETSNEEVVKIIERLTKKKIATEKVDLFRNYDSEHWSADTHHADEMGWCATVKLEDGIKEMINYYKNNGNFGTARKTN